MRRKGVAGEGGCAFAHLNTRQSKHFPLHHLCISSSCKAVTEPLHGKGSAMSTRSKPTLSWKENCEQTSTGTPEILCGSGLWGFYHSPGFLNWEKPLCLSLWASIKQKSCRESLAAMFTLLQQLAFSLPRFLPPSVPKPENSLANSIFPLCSQVQHQGKAAFAGSLFSSTQPSGLTACCHKACWLWKSCSDSQHDIYFWCFTAARGSMEKELFHPGTRGAQSGSPASQGGPSAL